MRAMSFRALNIILKTAHYFAMTPIIVNGNRLKFPSKAQIYLTVGFYSMGVAISGFYRYDYYIELSGDNLFVQFCLDLTLYLLNVSIILTTKSRQSDWRKLLRNLRTIPGRDASSSPVFFLIRNILYFLMQIYLTLIFAPLFQWDFYKQYAIEYVQFYSQFLLYCLLNVILKMILQRYQKLAEFLSRQLRNPHSFLYLSKIKKDVCILGDTSDKFNKLFGCSFLLVILFTSLQILIYLKTIFTKFRATPVILGFKIFFILWHFVGTFTNIFLCDSIKDEAEKMLTAAYALDANFVRGKGTSQEIRLLVKCMKDNIPDFTAARFFDITRTTVFRIFNTLVTFLIVMIQFHEIRLASLEAASHYNSTN